MIFSTITKYFLPFVRNMLNCGCPKCSSTEEDNTEIKAALTKFWSWKASQVQPESFWTKSPKALQDILARVKRWKFKPLIWIKLCSNWNLSIFCITDNCSISVYMDFFSSLLCWCVYNSIFVVQGTSTVFVSCCSRASSDFGGTRTELLYLALCRKRNAKNIFEVLQTFLKRKTIFLECFLNASLLKLL